MNKYICTFGAIHTHMYRYIYMQGGEILCGGEKPENIPENCANGYYLKPTVIAGLDPYTSRVAREVCIF